MINVVTTVGLDTILLHHFVTHYKSLGVDNIYVVVWGDSKKVKYKEIVDVLETHNLEIYKDLRDVNTGDAEYLTDIYNDVISDKPNEWWIVADLDEFAVFPKPVDEFINKDLKYNDFAYGLVLDRVGENGEFNELKYEDDIWERFPNVGYVSRYVRQNDSRGVILLKGTAGKIGGGQHCFSRHMMSTDDWEVYVKDKNWWPPMVQIHHFRWGKNNIKIEKEYIRMGDKWWGWEHESVLNYMLDNKKVDITDSRFLIERCPNNQFNSYSRWDEVIQLPTYRVL
tara:strand:+ start:1280 stop:2125 length:846 start_codon:yes stop_codon:yes gene_type:complete